MVVLAAFASFGGCNCQEKGSESPSVIPDKEPAKDDGMRKIRPRAREAADEIRREKELQVQDAG